MYKYCKKTIIILMILMPHLHMYPAQPIAALAQYVKSTARCSPALKVVRFHAEDGSIEQTITHEDSDSDDEGTIHGHYMPISQIKPSTLLFSINEREFCYQGMLSDLSKSDADLKLFNTTAYKEIKTHLEKGNFLDVSEKYLKQERSALLVGTKDDADGQEFVEAEPHTWPLHSQEWGLLPGMDLLMRKKYAAQCVWE